jgi:cytidylate kinase
MSSTATRREKPVIAIDGPAGAGKSTLAAHLARRFGFLNLETGAMYRALALKAIEGDASFEDEPALVKMARDSHITLEPTLTGNRVLLDGRDVSARIRERDVTEAASKVSVHPLVRQWMVARQREMGAGGGVVMEGRDIGTKVFPEADLKIFLDADPVVREQRRLDQLRNFDQRRIPGASAESMAADLRERDRRDRTRAASPLVAAGDAVVIDSTQLSEDAGVERIGELAEEKLAAKGTKLLL